MILVAVVADGVGVADQVEPVHGHALAEVGRGQEAVGGGLDGGSLVLTPPLLKLVDFPRSGRQADEVEGEAAEEGDRISVGGGLQLLPFEAVQDEVIDPVGGPVIRPHLGNRMATGANVGPGFAVGGALRDPLLQELLLLRRQFLVRLRGRHDLVGIGVVDAGDHFALVRLAGDDGIGQFAALGGALEGVEPQAGLALLFVRSVTGETVVGEDGADVAVEVDLGRGRIRSEQPQRAQRAQGLDSEERHWLDLSLRSDGCNGGLPAHVAHLEGRAPACLVEDWIPAGGAPAQQFTKPPPRRPSAVPTPGSRSPRPCWVGPGPRPGRGGCRPHSRGLC